MKVSRLLLREASYNMQDISLNQIDYGGVYHLQYLDTTKDKKPDFYFVFVMQPNVDGKLHCLDLSLVEDTHFSKFFTDIRLENEEEVVQRKKDKKGYVKSSIRIGQRFYKQLIKPNKQLMKEKPYRVFIRNNIRNIRYIEYDVYKQLR